jgi:hypothetical protein
VLGRWIPLAQEKVKFQGLPARICWLGYGERAEFGLRLNDLVRRGEVKAPIVIGRDHLDTGSVASPFRETEKMKDGSDAVADWALLNALLNAVSGASWVSIHNGGGVGIGYSQHAGQVIVADGTEEMDARLERVLTPRRRRLPRSPLLRPQPQHQTPNAMNLHLTKRSAFLVTVLGFVLALSSIGGYVDHFIDYPPAILHLSSPWWELFSGELYWLDRSEAAPITLIGFQIFVGIGLAIVGIHEMRRRTRRKFNL